MSDSRTLQETQTIGIHDVLKGLQSIIGRIQTRSAVCKFSDVTTGSPSSLCERPCYPHLITKYSNIGSRS